MPGAAQTFVVLCRAVLGMPIEASVQSLCRAAHACHALASVWNIRHTAIETVPQRGARQPARELVTHGVLRFSKPGSLANRPYKFLRTHRRWHCCGW